MAATLQNMEKHVVESGRTSGESFKFLKTPRPDSKDEIITSQGDEPAAEQDIHYITGWKLFAATGIVGLASFIMLLDTAIIVTAIPRITSDFHSLPDVGWYGSAYLLASSSLQPMTGKLYQRFSYKYTYLIFIGIFEIGSLICGVANSSNMFIVGRAIAGMGGSGLMNGGLTILSACAPIEKRATYLGFIMGVAQLGILFGPLLGGALTEYTTWRWCFYINLPIGAIIASALAFIPIPDHKKSTTHSSIKETLQSLDIFGFLLFAPTMVMFLLALEWGGVSHAWNSSIIIGLFCGAAVNFLIFLAWEYRKGDDAMIPLPMIKQRVVYSSCLTIFFFAGSLMIISYYLAIYFQAVRGYSPTISGVYALPNILPTMFFAVIGGIMIQRIGYYLPFSVISGTLQALGIGLMSTYTPTTIVANWVGFQFLCGVGRGLGMQIPIVAVGNHLPQSQNAVGIAILVFAQSFGGSIWLAIASTTFSSSLVDALKKYAPTVSPLVVQTAGATRFRAIVGEEQVPNVVKAYNEAINKVFYIAAGCAAVYTVTSLGMGWKSVKKVKKVKVEVEN